MARIVWSSTGYYTLTVPVAPSISSTGATLAAWFMIPGNSTPSSNCTLIGVGASGAATQYYGLGLNTGSGLRPGAFSSNGSELDAFGYALTKGQWYCLAAVFNYHNSQEYLYQNGVSQSNTGWSAPTVALNTITIGALEFGGSILSRPNAPVWIAEVGFWNTMLAPSELADMWSARKPMNAYRSANLFGYWPLQGRDAVEADLSGHGRIMKPVGGMPAVLHPPVYPIRNPLNVLAGPNNVFAYSPSGGFALSGSASVTVNYNSYQPSGAIVWNGTINQSGLPSVSRVQYTTANANSSAGLTSIGFSYTSNTTAANMLVVGIAYNGSGSVTGPSGWTNVATVANGSTASVSVWAYGNAPSISTSQTFNFVSIHPVCATLVAAEYAGLTGSVDADTTTTFTATTVTTGTLATATNDLLFAVIGQATAAILAPTYSSPTNSFSLVCQTQAINTPTPHAGASVCLLDLVTSSTVGSYSTGVTSGSAIAGCTVLVGLTVASAGSPFVTGIDLTSGALVLGGNAGQANYQYTGSGALTFTGLATATPSNGFSYAGMGALVLSGSQPVDFITCKVQPAGALVWSGSQPVDFITGVVQPAGGLTFAGVSPGNQAWYFEPAGGLALNNSGSPPDTVTGIVQPTGTLLLVGFVPVDYLTLNVIDNTGGLTLTGLAQDNPGQSYIGSGSLTLSGLATYRQTFPNNVGTGALTLTGFADYNFVTMSGGFLFSQGSVPCDYVTLDYTLAGGALTATGLGNGGFFPAANGGFELTGSASYSVRAIIQPAGALVVSGLAGVYGKLASQSGTGGLSISGLAVEYIKASFPATGSLLFHGLATEQTTGVYGSGGALVLNGSAFVDTASPYQPAGGFTLSGSATVSLAAGIAATGGLTLSGAVADPDTVSGLVASTGALVLSGMADTAPGFAVQPVGGFTVSGAVPVDRIAGTVQPTGSLVIGGLGREFITASFQPSGSLILSGLAGVSGVLPGYQASGRLVLSGSAPASWQSTGGGGGTASGQGRNFRRLAPGSTFARDNPGGFFRRLQPGNKFTTSG